MRGHRRVSCNDLGKGDCEGWLWKKKTEGNSPVSSSPAISFKWSKRWVVIKNSAIYCFRGNEVEDERAAESYILLPGYKVQPANECKRKYAFKITHTERKTFYFAAERQIDQSRWMNKMQLASIQYYEEKVVTQKEEAYLSESEEELESPSTQKDLDNSNILEGTSKSFLYQDGITPRSSPSKVSKNNRKKSQYLDDLPLDGKNEKIRNNSQDDCSLPRKIKENTSKGENRKKVTAKRTQSQLRPSSGNSFTSFLTNRLRKSPSSISIDKKGRKKEKNDRRSAGFLWSPKVSEKNRLSAPGTPSSGYFYRRSYDPSHQSYLSGENSSVSMVSSDRSGSSTPKQNEENGRNSIKITISPKNRKSYTFKEVNGDNNIKKEENQEASTHQELFAAIKKAEVDINGGDRKTSLRRKMTVLSRDPTKNEKMLKKRALQRELKAKEQELEYYNQLLKDGISSVSNHHLHLWINQHLSLVADMGTIRQMVRKKKRDAVANVNFSPSENTTESKFYEKVFESSDIENIKKEDEISAKLKGLLLEEDNYYTKSNEDLVKEESSLDGRSPSIETLINNVNNFMKSSEDREKVPDNLEKSLKTTVNKALVNNASNDNDEQQEPTLTKTSDENVEKNINLNNNVSRKRSKSQDFDNSDKVYIDNLTTNESFQKKNDSFSYLETDL